MAFDQPGKAVNSFDESYYQRCGGCELVKQIARVPKNPENVGFWQVL